ncbi:putative Ig domain-containing protein [Larkinella sp. VNQ87]|uniref:putative Ig domain-containing protein n=1 Tax=Larkinella sp. VNQ87 TaxID=3400921 RepID=UPI003BFE7523
MSKCLRVRSLLPGRLWKGLWIFLFIQVFTHFAKAQSQPGKLWDKTFGGEDNEYLNDVLATSDGGYLLGGTSWSDKGADKTENSRGPAGFRGETDIWLVKVKADGTKQWDKTIGSNPSESLTSLVATADGGYLLGGSANTSIYEHVGDKTATGKGGSDYWLVKINANGAIQWDKTFGGGSNDVLVSLLKTADGGYLLAGYSASSTGDDKTEASKGGTDYWLVKLKADGTRQWDKTYGGLYSDRLSAIVATTDGGYLLGGYFSTEQTPISGLSEYWLTKLDANGAKQWDKKVGENPNSMATKLLVANDGGYLLGWTSGLNPDGGQTEPSKGGYDFWLFKFGSDGTKQWDKIYGGSKNDNLYILTTTADKGYLLGGVSVSGISHDKTEDSYRNSFDYWIVKIDEKGARQWDKRFGGVYNDALTNIVPTQDGNYLLGGYSSSVLSGDKTEDNRGIDHDYWILKAKSNDCAFPVSIQTTSDGLSCTNQSVTLTAKNAGPAQSYRWSTGATTATILVSTAGSYWVQGTASNGCMTQATKTIGGSTTAPSVPQLSASSLLTTNQPISVTAAGCSGQLNWTVKGGTGVANGPIYTLSAPGQYTVAATCTLNSCTSPSASLTVRIQPAVSPLKLVAPTYNCQTGAITFNTQGGNGSLIEYMAAGITRWSSSRNHTVEAGLRQDPKVLLLQARQSGVLVSYNFDLPAACSPSSPTNTPPQPPAPPLLISAQVAQVDIPFSGTLVTFTDKETPSSLTYTLRGLPGGLSFNQTGRVISGKPTQAGSFVITYRATDAQGASNSIDFILTVNSASPTPVTGNFDGYLDKVECGTIRGWAWDRNKPNTPVTIEFYTGNTVWGSAEATIYRDDLKNAGKGNGAHAYSFEVPNTLKDGTPRIIYARVQGSSYELKWSGKPLHCPSSVRLPFNSRESNSDLSVVVLGNPVTNGEVLVEIKGAKDQVITLTLVDTEGRIVNQTQVKMTQHEERHRLSLNQKLSGFLLLRASTKSFSKTLKLIHEN